MNAITLIRRHWFEATQALSTHLPKRSGSFVSTSILDLETVTRGRKSRYFLSGEPTRCVHLKQRSDSLVTSSAQVPGFERANAVHAMMMKALNAATQTVCRPILSYDSCRGLNSAGPFPPLSLAERSDAPPAPRGTIVADHYWTEIYRCAARWILVPAPLALESFSCSTCGTNQTPTYLSEDVSSGHLNETLCWRTVVLQ
jgi:hypothetical protein